MLSLALIFGFILLPILGLITLKYEKETINSFNQFINDPNNTKQDILEEIFNDSELEEPEPQITRGRGTVSGKRGKRGKRRKTGNCNSNGKPSDLASYLLVCSMIAFSLIVLTILLLSGDNKYVSYGLVFAMFIENLGIQWRWSNGCALLLIACPMELYPIVTTMTTIVSSIITATEVQIFGMLADETHQYKGSMMFVAIIPIFGLFFSVMIHFNIV